MNEPQDENRQLGKQEPPSEIRALVPYYEYPDEGTDLVEIGAILWKRWKLMLVIFLACLTVGLLIAFLSPRVYEYTTTIEIGSQVVGSQNQPVESPNSAASKLQNGYLPRVVQQYAKAHGLIPAQFVFDVEIPPQANVVIISGNGTLADAEAYLTIEKSAARLLLASERPIIENQKSGLMEQLVQARSKLEQLKDPANLSLIKSQISDLTTYQQQARDQQLASSHHAGDPSSAMTQLLLSTQAQQASDQLFSLRQQLNNLSSNVASQEASVQNLKTQLGNLQLTRIVAGPMRSIGAVGLNPIIDAVVGAIAGIILALIGAACATYFSAVRRRVTVTTKQVKS